MLLDVVALTLAGSCPLAVRPLGFRLRQNQGSALSGEIAFAEAAKRKKLNVRNKRGKPPIDGIETGLKIAPRVSLLADKLPIKKAKRETQYLFLVAATNL